MVGQAQMEPLAFANNRGQCEQTSFAAPTDAKNRPAAYFHPVTLAIWIAVSSIFAQFMKWWPDPSNGFWGYIFVLPAFFTPAVPIMFFIDWYVRSEPLPLLLNQLILGHSG